MNKSWIKWGIAGSLVVAGIVLLDALFLEQYFFEIKTFDIGDKASNKRLKLVLLTDLHFKKNFLPFYSRLAKKVNELHPDLLVISGDVLDQTGKPAPVRKFFSLLNPNIAKAAILGNHDHKSDVHMSTIRKIYEGYNCKLLINESKKFTIGDHSIMVTGLDDFIEGNSKFKLAVKEVGKEEHHLLLIHSPLQQEKVLKEIAEINSKRSESDKLNIRYIFAGHNHGGQVCLFGYAPILPEKSGNYVNGWYNQDPPYLYLSKGFGTAKIPLRFGARSELTVFNYGMKD
jgi:hypothetical protein